MSLYICREMELNKKPPPSQYGSKLNTFHPLQIEFWYVGWVSRALMAELFEAYFATVQEQNSLNILEKEIISETKFLMILGYFVICTENTQRKFFVRRNCHLLP